MVFFRKLSVEYLLTLFSICPHDRCQPNPRAMTIHTEMDALRYEEYPFSVKSLIPVVPAEVNESNET